MPIQERASEHVNQSGESIDSIVFTLDPRDKYLPPGVRRAATTSAVEHRKTRLQRLKPLSSNEKKSSDAKQPPQLLDFAHDVETFERQSSLRSAFQRMRRTRSAGSGLRKSDSWHRKLFSRSGSAKRMLDDDETIPAVPKLPTDFSTAKRSSDVNNAKVGLSDDMAIKRAMAAPKSPPWDDTPSFCRSDERVLDSRHNDQQDTHSKPKDSYCTDLRTNGGAQRPIKPIDSEEQTNFHEVHSDISLDKKSDEITTLSQEYSDKLLLAGDSIEPTASSREEAAIDTSTSKRTSTPSKHGSLDFNCAYSESHLSSYMTEDNFSPGLGMGSLDHSRPASPLNLSEPLTPAANEFNYQETLVRPPSRAPPPPPLPPPTSLPLPNCEESPASSFSRSFHSPYSGFQGYSLPEVEQASALTIRKTPSTTVSHHSDRSPHNNNGKQDFIQLWNDGSEHRMTALEDLVDDLGYLGELII